MSFLTLPGSVDSMTTATLNKKRLSTYLNDHLAGATGGLELAKRTAGGNEGSEFGPALQTLAKEIEEDRNTLLTVMERLEVSKDQLKVSMGWVAEKVGRLKPNGQLTGYSPLSRQIELEGLLIGITGKRALWTALQQVQPADSRLSEFDFQALIDRADSQRERVEEQRVKASQLALTD